MGLFTFGPGCNHGDLIEGSVCKYTWVPALIGQVLVTLLCWSALAKDVVWKVSTLLLHLKNLPYNAQDIECTWCTVFAVLWGVWSFVHHFLSLCAVHCTECGNIQPPQLHCVRLHWSRTTTCHCLSCLSLQRLTIMISLFPNSFNEKMCDQLLAHLHRWVDVLASNAKQTRRGEVRGWARVD